MLNPINPVSGKSYLRVNFWFWSVLFLFCPLLVQGADIVISGSVATSGHTRWTKDNTYILDGRVEATYVDLVVEAGTVVRGRARDAGDPSMLVIGAGSSLWVAGTQAEPVIFTAEADDLSGNLGETDRGLWGGIQVSEASYLRLYYTSIRHAGAGVGEEETQATLQIGADQSNVEGNHIEVYAGAGAGYRFVRTSTRLHHLASVYNAGPAFAFEGAFSGRLQYLLGLQSTGCVAPLILAENTLDENSSDYTVPAISNLTGLGGGLAAGSDNVAVHFENNGAGFLYNSILSGFGGPAMVVGASESETVNLWSWLASGHLTMRGTVLGEFGAGSSGDELFVSEGSPAPTGNPVRDMVLDFDNANQINTDLAGGDWLDWPLGGQLARLPSLSPARIGAVAFPYGLPWTWFTGVSYRGAFQEENWLAGWSKLSADNEFAVTVAPSLVSTPTDQLVAVGGTIILQVVADGSGPLGYQWYKDGTLIPGATSATYSLANATTSSAGDYRVDVSNDHGTTPSTDIGVSVIEVGVTATETTPAVGDAVSLSFQGNEALSYEWRHNGVVLAGESGSTLSLSVLSRSDRGLYNLVASYAEGSVDVPGVWLEVVPAEVENNFETSASFAPRFEDERTGDIRAVIELSDGGFLVGGDFHRWGDVTRDYLVRLESDGSVDESWSPPEVTGPVETLAIDTAGKIWVGGEFGFVEGERSGGLFRLTSDLDVDASFRVGIGFNGPVLALLAESDGAMLVGGEFNTYQSDLVRRVIRLGSDATVDAGFTLSTSLSPGRVEALIRMASDKVAAVADGYVSSYTKSGYAGAFDGDGSAYWQFSDSFGQALLTGSISPDGGLVVGGGTLLYETGAIRLHRITAEGAKSYILPTIPGDLVRGVTVTFLSVLADGRILVAGEGFTPRLLNADGSFNAYFGGDADVERIFVQSEPDAATLRLWSRFSATDSANQSGFIDLDLDAGTLGTPLQHAVRGPAEIYQLENAPEGRLWVRGAFTHVDGVARGGLAILEADGTLNTDFVPALQLPVQDSGRAVFLTDGRTVVGDGESLVRLLADGTRDANFSEPAARTNDIVTVDGGALLVASSGEGGIFGGDVGVMRIGTDGIPDPSFGPFVTGNPPTALFPQADGSVFLAGQLSTVNGAVVYDVLRQISAAGNIVQTFNFTSPLSFGEGSLGSVIAWSNNGNNIYQIRSTGEVSSSYTPNSFNQLLALPDGGFMRFGSAQRDETENTERVIQRLSATGAVDTSFQLAGWDPSRGAVSVAVQMDDGSLAVTGMGMTAYGHAIHGLARLQPAEEARVVTQSTDLTASPGDDLTLSVSAEGSGVLTYQWYFNGIALSGETGAELALSDIVVAQGGTYYAVVTGPFNSVQTDPIVLSGTNPVPTIEVQPEGGEWEVGDTFSLSVTAQASGTMAYQWYRDGAAIPGATNATLEVADAQMGDAGLYRVMVSDGLSATNSALAAVAINPVPGPSYMLEDEEFVAVFEKRAGKVERIVPGPEGGLFISGVFSRVDGAVRPGIALIAADGTLDTTFAPTGRVMMQVLTSLSDGGVLVARLKPISSTGAQESELLRLDATGAIDETFTADASVHFPYRVAEQPDGRLIVLQSNSSPVLRLESDGALDSSYAPDFRNGGTVASPRNVLVQSDGMAVFSAGYSQINGIDRTTPLRLDADGVLDDSFALELTPGEGVAHLALDSTDRIWAAGWFGLPGETYPHQQYAAVTRFLADGSVDPDFTRIAPSANNGSGQGRSVVVDANGVWAVVSSFSSGNYPYHIVRLTEGGAITWESTLSLQYLSPAPSLGVTANEIALFGGEGVRLPEQTFADAGVSFLAISAEGQIQNEDPAYTEAETNVAAAVNGPEGSLFFAGDFTRYNGELVNGIVRTSAVGARDASFAPSSAVDGSIKCILAEPDGALLVGGDFSQFGDVAASDLIRLLPSGLLDTDYANTFDGQSGAVQLLAADPQGGIMVSHSGYGVGLLRLDSKGRRDTRFSYAPPSSSPSVISVQFGSAGTPYVLDAAGLFKLDRTGQIVESRSVFSAILVKDDNAIWGGWSQSTYLEVSPNYWTVLYRPSLSRFTAGLTIDYDNIFEMLDIEFGMVSRNAGPTHILPVAGGGVLVNDQAGLHLWDGDGYLAEADLWGDTKVVRGDGSGGARWCLLRPNGGVLVSGDGMSHNGSQRFGVLAFTPHAFGEISSPVENTTLDTGNALSLTVTVDGTGPYTYQWRRYGQAIDGADGASYQVSSVGPEDAGAYDVVISDGVETRTSAVAMVEVQHPEPLSRSLVSLSSPTRLDAAGPVIVPFRIEGVGSKRLLVRAVGPTLARFGVADAVADPVLTVRDYTGTKVTSNDNWMDQDDAGAAVGAAATDSGAFALGTGLADAALVVELSEGSYSLEIRSAVAGQVLAEIYDLDEVGATSRLVYAGMRGSIVSPGESMPVGLVLEEGASRGLLFRALGQSGQWSSLEEDPKFSILDSISSVVAGGTNDNWKREDYAEATFAMAGASPLIRSSSDAMSILSLDEGVYTAKVESARSYVLPYRNQLFFELFDLTARNPAEEPLVLDPPTSTAVEIGAFHRLLVWALGGTDLSYQWRKDGEPIEGATGRGFAWSAFSAEDVGTYDVVVSSAEGSTISAPATLTVYYPVEIVQSPRQQRVAVGADATFTVTATGSSPMSYQWYRDEVALTGETGSSLTLENVTADQSGNYTVAVANGQDPVYATAAQLEVVVPGIDAVARTLGGGAASYTVQVSALDSWSATTTADWVTLTPSSGTGSGLVEVKVAANTNGSDREVVLTINGVEHVLTQQGTFAGGTELMGMGSDQWGQLATGRELRQLWPRDLGIDEVAQVAMGYSYAAFLRTDGSLWVMGTLTTVDDAAGDPILRRLPSKIAENVTDLAAGDGHLMFVQTDGSLWGVGGNSFGQLGIGTRESNATPVQVAEAVAAVEAGAQFTLFLKTDGSLWGMGANTSGCLGDGSTENRDLPVQIDSEVSAFAAGAEHTLYVKTDGSVWATGDNSGGALGDGSTTNRSTPVEVASDGTAVSANASSSLLLKSDGSAWVAGWSVSGDGADTTMHTSFDRIATGVTQVEAGAGYSLFLRDDGDLWGCGSNAGGNLGVGTTEKQRSVVWLAADVATMAAGQECSLFVDLDGRLWGMGQSVHGQLADGAVQTRVTAHQLAFGVVDCVAHTNRSLWIDHDHTLWAAGGRWDTGSIGFVESSQPVAVANAVRSVAVGSSLTMWVTTDGILWGLSSNTYGQLGDGTNLIHSTPVVVADEVAAVAVGDFHSVVLKTDGSLWTAGFNGLGQLGTGDLDNRQTFVQIDTEVEAVAAYGHQTFFIKRDGSLWAAGWNFIGQLGDGSNTNAASPVKIADDVIAVDTGAWHSAFVKSDGSLWVMGANWSAQLGDGTLDSRSTPVQVATGVESVSTSSNHTLFVRSDDTLWGMGSNSAGQLGLAAASLQLTPVRLATGVKSASAGEAHSLWLRFAPSPFGRPGDLDGDGVGELLWQDVASGARQLRAVDGKTTHLTAIPAGWWIEVLGDFNADGENDVIARNLSSVERRFWMRQDGVLTPATSLPEMDSSWTLAGAGDFDRDGQMDLVWQHEDGRRLISFMDGVSATDRSVEITSVPADWTIAGVADFNHDGYADLLWRHVEQGLLLAWLMEDGVYRSGADMGAVSASWKLAQVSDLNGDDDVDLVWHNTETGGNAVWILDGTTTESVFSVESPGEDWVAGTSVVPEQPTVLHPQFDLNGDGQVDILWRHRPSGEVGVWLMDGTTVSGYVRLGSAGEDYEIRGTGDFTGDGQSDILWRHRPSGEIGVWSMDGTTVAGYTRIANLDSDYVIRGTADFNGDGQTDILLRHTPSGEVGIWLMNETSVTGYVAVATVSTDYVLSGTGDFNDDGHFDILFQNTLTGEVGVSLMDGTSITAYTPISSTGSDYVLSGTGDYNGDGSTDILWRHTSSGEVGAWLMNGTTLSSYAPLSAVGGDYVLAINGEPEAEEDEVQLKLDLNRDGQEDILWRNSSTGEAIVWLMDGTSLTTYASLGTVDLGYQLAQWGDFDENGHADLVWRHTTTGEVGVWLMNETTVNSYVSLGSVNTAYALVGAGDFNGDGHRDILWRHTPSGEVGVWLMDGTTVSGYQVIGVVNTDYVVAGTADFNGDGKVDILWRHGPSGEVGTWLMDGTTVSSYVSISSVSTAYTITGTGDFNGDGSVDILWRHDASGELGMWLMDGTTPSAYRYVDSVPTVWQVCN